MTPLLSMLVYLVVVLAVVGILLWGLTQLPIDPTIQRIIRVVVIVGAALFALVVLLRLAGVAVPGIG